LNGFQELGHISAQLAMLAAGNEGHVPCITPLVSHVEQQSSCDIRFVTCIVAAGLAAAHAIATPALNPR